MRYACSLQPLILLVLLDLPDLTLLPWVVMRARVTIPVPRSGQIIPAFSVFLGGSSCSYGQRNHAISPLMISWAWVDSVDVNNSEAESNLCK